MAEVRKPAAAPDIAVGVAALRRHWREILLLPFAVWALALYKIEGGDALIVMTSIAVGGFVVSCMLPLNLRLPFFALLSLGGILAVFGLLNGAWLLGVGFVLIGICHLPLPIKARVAIMVLAGAGLAVMRAGIFKAPWSGMIWPILASMFIFRVALYLKSLSTAATDKPPRDSGPWSTISYFFMLPNAVFPLFPVVDHQNFVRNRFDKGDAEIYATGVQWIVRGVMHLVLYRIVYLVILEDPTDVVTLGDLVQYMLGTFLLYLRVSGQFHLIVGLLYLFGFRLPETHKLYYLAHSFTELWRRINIYWTDFMTKFVFYPVYFKVKHLKPTVAMGISTVVVFVVTWALHSYQWFWLRGESYLTATDALFWAILGGLVVVGGLRELTAPKKLKARTTGWSGVQAFKATRTFLIFCTLWSLWNAESLGQWLWMLGAASVVDVRGVVLAVLALATIGGLGGYEWGARKPGEATKTRFAWLTSARTRSVATLVALILLAQPAVFRLLPGAPGRALTAVHSQSLNAADAALKHRGYYEQLDARNQLVEHAADVDPRRADWQNLNQTGVVRETHDELLRDLAPSRSFTWNGHRFTTNSFGMRDREYPRAKPANTVRVALLGPSHVMGNGVSDDQTFDNVLEQEMKLASGARLEVLNFAVEGYSLPQEAALFEARALSFEPDVAILTIFHPCTTMTERYLQRVASEALPMTDAPTRELLAGIGLMDIDRGRIPLPYVRVRNFARQFGLDVRMPQAEIDWRVRRVAEAVTQRAIERFARLARARGIKPVVLVLNAVVDGGPTDVPYRAALAAADLPVIDLSNIYPEGQHAQLRVNAWDDHPNAVAHRKIAGAIERELGPMLENLR